MLFQKFFLKSSFLKKRLETRPRPWHFLKTRQKERKKGLHCRRYFLPLLIFFNKSLKLKSYNNSDAELK